MSEKRKELVVGFEVVIKEFESKFIGECKELPGLVVSGASTGEVIKNIKAAIPLFLRYVPKESFIPVFENSTMPVIYDFEEFNRHLYASTSKDAVIRTATGDIGAWENISVSNIFSPYFNPPVGSTKNFQEDSLGDYTPQAYCLKAFNDLGTPKLYAGTNANGGIYETLDGNNWSLAFNSGEARVHCLEAFRGRLFAGTSTEGKIYSYNGTHWVISLSTPELAITCFGLYRDYIYAGTYPNGMIYRTSDGVNWQKVFDTNQSFVNDFIVYKNRFYAATAKATGGLIFMSEDGTNWVENFFSEKDANFFKFGVFANSIYAGSGNNGRIYKSVDGKQWELAFQTDEEDIRSLVVFNGYLYFGSSPKGRIFRTTISNTPPPRAFDVQITDITSHSAVISWVTDREAKTIIEYGTTSSYGNTIMNEKKASSHRITLNNLKAVTEYHFRILTYSDIGSFSGIVEDHKFSTMAAITPVISSKTHPDQNKWYNSNEAGIHWGMHPEIKRYLYLADRNPETIPGPAKCESSTAEGVVLKGLEDGVWYVHFMIEDKAGNISPSVSHFTIRVDTSALPPKVTSATHADEAAWYDSNTPEFTWVPPEDMSGVEGYYYCVDELAVTVPNEKNGIFTEETKVRLEPVEDGVKYFHIVTKDKAGNTGTKASHFRFNVDTHAIPPLISSRTHPDPESWYNGKIVEIHLAKPHDLSGIEGFYFCVDSRPDTVPREHDWVYTRSSDIEIPERPDGVWYIHARSKDTAGNISKDASHFKFRIDTVAYPPNISSVTHPDTHKWYNIKKAQFKVMAPEDMSGIEGYYYIIDNEEKTVPGDTATWTDKDTVFSGDLKDGKWFLHVTAKDRAGNIGRSASHYSFNIDTAAKPPKVMSKTHADQEAWHNNPIPELHWETPEDISGIEGYYFIYDQKHNTVPTKEAGEWTTANQMTLPLLADGVWYFHIVSKDNAGNTGWEAAHYKIKIDTVVDQPKIHSSTHPDETKWYCGSAVKLGWTVPQDLSKIKVFHWVFSKEKYMKLPIEMAQQTDKREMEIDVDKEGTYYFHISGEDNAGNIGSEPAVFGVNIDLKAEPPEIISTTHPNSDRYYADIHPVFVLEQNRDLSGVEGYYYKLDREKDTAPDRKTARFSKENVIKIAEPLEAGTWYFHVITKDRAGNTGAEAAHYRIQIETTPPEVSVKPLPEFSPSENFEVGWEGEDSESGILCFTAEYKEGEKGKWKGWLKETRAKSGIFKGEDGITYYFRVRARDNAGNWSEFYEQGSVRTTVDVSPPSQITQIVAKPAAEGKIILEWGKSVDSVSGLDFYRVYRSSVSGQVGMQICDDGEVRETTFTDESADIEDGIIYYYTVRPVDCVGNERESGNKQVLAICDRYALPPVIRSVTHPMQEQWYNNRNLKITWDTPQDATRITGYYYIFDQIASTVPDAKTGTWFTDNEIDFNGLSDGTWYFHVISKDEAGNVSDEAAHYRVNIDTSRPKPPVITSITHGDFNQWYNNNAPSFSWTTPSDPAGIEGYYYLFNQIKETRPDITASNWTKGTMASFVDVPDGVWYLHVTAKDTAGNISEEASRMQVNVAMTPPPPSVFSSTHPDPDKWYRDKEVKIQWKPMDYVNEIIGYYYLLDNMENSVPTPKNSKTMDTALSLPDLSDGLWYFHIVSVDREGIIGKTAAHFPVKIKTKVTLKGVVTQSNGIMPLAGATVEVMSENGTTLGLCISDKEGSFSVENLPVATVRIKVISKGLPPQMIYGVELKSDEAERYMNISSEIFAMHEPASKKIVINYYIPEDGAVTIKFYNEAGKIINTIEEKKKGRVYNSNTIDASGLEPGMYLYQVTSKGDVTGKLTRYAIRKIKIT